MTFKLLDMASTLRLHGLKVVEHVGWTAVGHGDMREIVGIMCHHTASSKKAKDIDVVEGIFKGRSDLPGPDANLVLGRDGTYYCIAAGKSWHAGYGSWKSLTPSIWNSSFIGIEAINDGLPDDPWNPIQYEAYAKGCAALLEHTSLETEWCVGHKEYALPKGRKPDPSFDMNVFRSDIDKYRRK